SRVTCSITCHPTSRASARNSSSIAAVTCSTSIRNREGPSRPTHGQCIRLPDQGRIERGSRVSRRPKTWRHCNAKPAEAFEKPTSAGSRPSASLGHDPEKWKPTFGKDHAPTKLL